ncbi:MAG: hypothetical protein Q4F74_06145 [Synergistaceae bacterium]|nr:hypothetical protein [Synergistaceae bacterium]
MADKYCPNCKRMVGTSKNLVPGILTIVIGILLFYFLPLLGWIIGPLLVLIGIIVLLGGGKKCPLCGSKSLLNFDPNAAEAVRQTPTVAVAPTQPQPTETSPQNEAPKAEE